MNSDFSRDGRGPALVLALILGAVICPAAENSYTVHNLVSDGTIPADHTDPRLVNAWGVSRSPTGPWWVADNGTGYSTIYDGNGNINSLFVLVPGAPTGTVYNGGIGFVITDGTNSGPALFLFDSEDGTVSGWSPAVPPPPPSHQAFVAVDNSAAGAIYKGLAIASTPAGDRLYAADFHNARIDVFDASFQPVVNPGAFVDPGIPAGFAPFNVQNLNGMIFVAYAMQDEAGEDEIAGPGLGFVSVFDTSGKYLSRIASKGALNAPWGMTIAPQGFGAFSGKLLVGNFGDGRINAYGLTAADRTSVGAALGHLETADHQPVVIDGLWGIDFGNGAGAGPTTTLYFAAGPDEETHGLFGSIIAN
jgi:uncharacterized protein (TIGR03118 family)